MTNIKQILHVFLLSLFLGNTALAGETTPESLAGTTKVSAEEVIGLLEKHADLVLIDARKSSDHNKGYIEGSVALPNTDTTAESLAKHIKTKNTPIVFYCNGVKCGRSVESAKKALDAGYSKVYWFRGGWEEWTNKGLPVTK